MSAPQRAPLGAFRPPSTHPLPGHASAERIRAWSQIRRSLSADLVDQVAERPGWGWNALRSHVDGVVSAWAAELSAAGRRALGAAERTDGANVAKLIDALADDVRFAPGIGWQVLGAQGWRRDLTGEVERRAKAVTDAIIADGRALGDERLVDWGLRSQSLAGLRRMMRGAEAALSAQARRAS